MSFLDAGTISGQRRIRSRRAILLRLAQKMRDELPRLAEDHEKARLLAGIAARAPGASVIPPETNIVFARFDRPHAQLVGDRLQEAGVRVSVMGESALRLVTHKDVSIEDCAAAGAALLEAAKVR